MISKQSSTSTFWFSMTLTNNLADQDPWSTEGFALRIVFVFLLFGNHNKRAGTAEKVGG